MKINGIVKNLREIMNEFFFVCFVFLASAFDKKKFKCNAGKTQLLPYYDRAGLFLLNKVFKKYLSSSFPGGESAGWQPKEIDFCLLWIKQLTSYVKAIVEM